MIRWSTLEYSGNSRFYRTVTVWQVWGVTWWTRVGSWHST